MKTPLVSIIIPVYNSYKLISKTLESALDQTYKNIEIIVIDDGSTDGSEKIIDQFASDKITLLKQNNKGAGAARNLGIKNAKGEFMQFLDADDLLSANKIDVQVNALGKSKKLAVCPTVHFQNGTNPFVQPINTYETQFLFNTDNTYEFLINLWGGNDNRASMIQTNAWLVPKALIEENRLWEEYYSPDDDGEYFSRLILSSQGIVYTPDCYNYYRKFETSASLSNRSSYKSIEGIFKSICAKKLTLEPYLNDVRARRAISRQFHDILYTSYPQHSNLTKLIQKEINELGIKIPPPSLGGNIINLITYCFGWKFSRYVQNIKLNILSRK